MIEVFDGERLPSLTRSDAWLLAALTEGSYDGRAMTLQDLIHDADWLNRSIPTFDEISFGLPRLVAAGYLTVDADAEGGLALRATSRAIRVGRAVRANARDGVIVAMEKAVSRPRPEPDPEDRSLGRLTGLDQPTFERAVAAHSMWVQRMGEHFIVGADE